jgi:hypothetical protein
MLVILGQYKIYIYLYIDNVISSIYCNNGILFKKINLNSS